MTGVVPWRALLVFSRPRQWPILTAQWGVGVVLAQPAGAGLAALLAPDALGVTVAAWVAWVVLLNGGTLAYNSAWDRDTEAVAYLQRPPLPPPHLAGWALATMAGGAILGAVAVGTFFGAVTGGCVVLSVLYSHPASRWKARPGLDLLVNMAGYGAGTTGAGLLAGRAATGAPAAAADPWLVCGFALLFGSLYPTTQIYQVEADRARGDRTLTTAVGVPRALELALGLGAAAAICLVVAAGGGVGAWVTAAGCLPWLAHLAVWRQRRPGRDPAADERGMYRALMLWAVVDVAVVTARFL